jgi:ketosteroid isomerase-like protein
MSKDNVDQISELKKIAEKVHNAWNTAWSNNDIDALLDLYADDAIIESPLIPYLLKQERGICNGKKEFRKLLEIAAVRKPTNRQLYQNNYFTDGKTLMWEGCCLILMF